MTGEAPQSLSWLLVVARGQRQLAAELEALFREDVRVRVIEDRRDARTLLPRPDATAPSASPARPADCRP